MKSGIYKILNIVTNKCYVGRAICLKQRWRQHRHNLEHNKHGNRHLQFAWNKYWNISFKFEVIEYCEQDKLIEREQFWIDELKPEYNLEPHAAGSFGYKHTEETKRKLSISHMGIKQSKEARLKRSISLKGRKISDENIRKLSDINRILKRKPEKWQCNEGIRCKCENCMSKKREYGKLWAREKKAKNDFRSIFQACQIDNMPDIAIIKMPKAKWEVIRELLKL